jgi:hypothetical protein
MPVGTGAWSVLQAIVQDCIHTAGQQSVGLSVQLTGNGTIRLQQARTVQAVKYARLEHLERSNSSHRVSFAPVCLLRVKGRLVPAMVITS